MCAGLYGHPVCQIQDIKMWTRDQYVG